MIKYSNWIINRIDLFKAIIFDLAILSIPFKNNVYELSYSNQLFQSLIIILIWIIINYVIGRYHFNKGFDISYFKYFLKVISSSLIVIICIFMLSIFHFIFIDYSKLTYFLIEKSILSYVIQIIIYQIFSKGIRSSKSIWFFEGNENNFDMIKENINNNYHIITNKEEQLNELIKEQNNKFKGIIYDDDTNKNLNFKNTRLKFKNHLQKISILRWYELYFFKFPTELIKDTDLNYNYDNYDLQTRLKYISDIFLSFVILFLTLPLFLLFSILIKLEDNGPIFYSQKRVGKSGEEFKIWKFRSMKINAEKNGPVWSKRGDKRVTKIGKILRRTRIDELPQLFCVIKGEMSLIGPRPERPEIEKDLEKEIPYYFYRRAFKPGLSGWAQVNYPYGASLKDSKEKTSYDIFYIENFSNLLDIIIFFKTIKLVFNLKGSLPNN